MYTNGIVKVEGGIDWITVTGDRPNSWDCVSGMAMTLWEQQTNAGYKNSYVTRHGFSLSCVSGIQFGKSKGGWMIVLTGELARSYWRPFAAYGKNVTRLDLQSTIYYENDAQSQIKAIHRKAYDEGDKRQREKMTLIDNPKKGDTLYYGSRSSPQFGRVYDKYREQKKHPAYLHAIRYEVEYKKPISGQIVQWLLDKDPQDDVIVSRVLNWFTSRGISVPEICTNPDDAIQYPQKETPIEKKLQWLRKSVRPVYRQLVAAGFQIEADGSLGVSDDAITLQPIERGQENGNG